MRSSRNAPENLSPAEPSVLGDGEMAKRIRDFAWDTTPLGPLQAWSESLIRSVNLILLAKWPAAILWGPHMIWLYNDAFCELLGEKHPGALGMPAREVWAEAWHLVGGQLDAAMRGESTFRENVLVPVLRVGHVEDVYWTYSYSPLFASPRVVEGVLILCRDTTKEVTSAARIRKSEDRLRTFVEAVSDVMYRVSADWSEALMVDGRGFIADTSVPDPHWFKRNVHPDDQPRVRAAIDAAIRDETVFELEHKVQRVDGTPGWTFSRAIPVRDEHGKVTEWFGAASDITARKLAEQALLSAEKLAVVGRLASSIAHEINNPLEAVTNLLYLAEQSADPATKLYLQTAQQELQRVSHITANTLRFHREKLVPAPVDIADIVRSVIDLYQGRSRQAGIQVILEIRECPQFVGLAGEIRQVLANLFANALDAMKRGGVLKIRVRTLRCWKTGEANICITIADNGCGMSRKTLEQAYKPFFTTKEATGTGLGLWISAEIVSRHGGAMQLRSSEAGGLRGTTFRLLFPVAGVAN